MKPPKVDSNHAGNLIAVFVILTLLCMSLSRLYPFQNELKSIMTGTGDDWNYYAQRALDIKYNGLLIPSLKNPYCLPAAFLYCYFLAFLFSIFGNNTVPVYLAQNIMLGLSISIIYFTFRKKLKPTTALLFFAALFVFAVLDVYKHYSFKLLGENLTLFTVSAFFFFFVNGFEKNRLYMQLGAALLMGLSILSRPNMILFGAFLIPIVAPYYFRKGKIGIFHYILFISILIFSTSLLMIRNYLVCGSYAFISKGATTSSLQFLTMTNPIPPSVDLSMTKARPFYATMHFNGILSDYSEYMIQKPAIFFGHYFKKILFCLGFLQYFEPAYRWRPHWILMWIGYFAYLFIHWKRRAGFEMWEIALNIYILSYYCLLVIAAMIGNYGFRYLIPAVPFLLPLSFKALDQMMPLPRRPHS